MNEIYRVERIHCLIDPTRDPEGDGYSIMRIRNLLSQVTLYGKEINVEKYRLGDLKSNFTLVYIIYNFGIVFGVICIATVIGFIVRIFNIMSKVKDFYGKTLI